MGVRVLRLWMEFWYFLLDVWSDFWHGPVLWNKKNNNADILMLIFSSLKAKSHIVWQYYTATNWKIVCFLEKIAEVRIQRTDALIAFFFNENGISLNVANSSSFGRIIRRNRWVRQTKSSLSLKNFFSNEKEFLMRGHSEALSDLLNVRDKVHRNHNRL